METNDTPTTERRWGMVRITDDADKLLDLIVERTKPTPTKGSVLEMLIEQEAARRGITNDADAA